MSTNTKIIEEKGIRILEDLLYLCKDNIEPDISRNDKSVAEDGKINIYKKDSKGFNTKKLEHSLKIQIKATETKASKKEIINSKRSFRFKKENFQALLNIGGLMFFLIDNIEETVYFRNLTVIFLKDCIEEINKKGGQTLKFDVYKFPKEKNKIYNKLKEESINLNDQLVDNLKIINHRKNNINNPSEKIILAPQLQNKTIKDILKDNEIGDTYFYKTVGAYAIPFKRIAPNKLGTMFTKKISFPSLKDKSYIAKIYKCKDYEYVTTGEDNLVTFIKYNDDNNIQLNIHGTSNLNKKINNLKIGMDVIKEKNISINDNIIKNDEKNTLTEKQLMDLSKLKKEYEECMLLKKIESTSHLPLSQDNLSQEDENKINNVLNYYFNYDKVLLEEGNYHYEPIYDIKIKNKIYYFYFFKNKNEKYPIIKSLFTKNVDLILSYENGTKLNPYTLLKHNKNNELDYIDQIGDFNPKLIIDWYKENKDKLYTQKHLMNIYSLNLISAFDRSKGNKYLSLAKEILKMLIKIDNDDTYFINYMQCIVRDINNKPNFDEIFKLKRITEKSNDKIINFCSLLVFSKISNTELTTINNSWNKLSREEKNNLIHSPIYKLYNV